MRVPVCVVHSCDSRVLVVWRRAHAGNWRSGGTHTRNEGKPCTTVRKTSTRETAVYSRCRHSGDTRDALYCAPLVVCLCQSARGAVHCCIHVSATYRAARPFPKGVAHSVPMRRPTPEHQHQGVPRTALTLGVVFGHTAECCVRLSRASRTRAQNAVLPYSHCEGRRVSRFTGTQLNWAVLPLFSNAKVQVCAVLPRVPRFITVLPLPLSLDHSHPLTGTSLESRRPGTAKIVRSRNNTRFSIENVFLSAILGSIACDPNSE